MEINKIYYELCKLEPKLKKSTPYDDPNFKNFYKLVFLLKSTKVPKSQLQFLNLCKIKIVKISNFIFNNLYPHSEQESANIHPSNIDLPDIEKALEQLEYKVKNINVSLKEDSEVIEASSVKTEESLETIDSLMKNIEEIEIEEFGTFVIVKKLGMVGLTFFCVNLILCII